MKKNVVTHLIWALVAGITFVLGSKFVSENSHDETGDARSSRTHLSSRQQSSANEKSRQPGSRGKSSRSSSGSSGSTLLTEADINALGETFKKGGLVERRLAFAEMLKNLTPENARHMREQIAHLSQDSPEFREFHYAWGAIAGEDAILNGKDTPKRDMAASLAGWASKDPDAALAYFNSLSPEQQNDGALMKWGAVYGLADHDPELATQFALQRMENGDKDAYKMIHLTADAVLRSGDFDQAAEWSTNIPKGPLQVTAVTRVAKEMADGDPARAYDWANSLPNSSSKFHAIGATFEKWAVHDAEEGARQLANLPENHRPSATYGFASRLAYIDPEAGIEWANTITVEKTRVNALIDTGRTYYKKDREGALNWLPNSGLTPEQQQKITGGR